jgi:cytochrome P450
MTEPSNPGSTSTTTSPSGLFEQLMDHGNRVDPYPLYEGMRQWPVVEGPGLLAVTRHSDIHALMRDPRLSSDPRKSAGRTAIWTDDIPEGREIGAPPFIFLDPPDHTRIRSLIVKEFRPRVIARLRPRIIEVIDELLNGVADREVIDFVAEFAMPLPITIICDLLGVPHEDVLRFQVWTRKIAHALDPGPTMTDEERVEGAAAVGDLFSYCRELADSRRADPRDDYLSALVGVEETGETLDEHDLLTSIGLLLVAGHETSVNLISNAMLTLLRHPEQLRKLKLEPQMAPAYVEETLRYEPPVHIRNRVALADLDVGGTTIPAGSNVALLLASGNRDPERFPRPDCFDPGRDSAGHFGFGGGPHFCVGAGLARLEAALALQALVARLEGPRLVADPPPYRPNAALRGPERLELAFERLGPPTATV